MASDNLQRTVLEHFECEVCHEIFTEPKTLPCGHTFCRQCIQHWLDQASVASVTCPSCRQRCSVPNRQAANLRTNIAMNRLCEVMRARGGAAEGADWVEGDRPSPSAPEQALCATHQQALTYVCLKCRPVNPLCSGCSPDHAGSAHDFRLASEAVEHCRRQVSDDLVQVRSAQRRLVQAMQQYETAMQVLLENVSHVSEQLLTRKDHIVESLESRYMEMYSGMQESIRAGETIRTSIQEQIDTSEVLVSLGNRCMTNSDTFGLIDDKVVFDQIRGQLQEDIPRTNAILDAGLWSLRFPEALLAGEQQLLDENYGQLLGVLTRGATQHSHTSHPTAVRTVNHNVTETQPQDPEDTSLDQTPSQPQPDVISSEHQLLAHNSQQVILTQPERKLTYVLTKEDTSDPCKACVSCCTCCGVCLAGLCYCLYHCCQAICCCPCCRN